MPENGPNRSLADRRCGAPNVRNFLQKNNWNAYSETPFFVPICDLILYSFHLRMRPGMYLPGFFYAWHLLWRRQPKSRPIIQKTAPD